MAFTKSPENNTYQTKQIELMQELDSRTDSVSKDVSYLNCFFDELQNKLTQEKDYNIVKRAGLASFGSALPSTNIRGLYYWEDEDKLYAVSGNDIWIATASTGVHITTKAGALATLNGNVGFTEFLYDDTTVKVVLSDGTKVYTIDSANNVVTVTDVDLPTPHLPVPVFLDGYLFIVKADSADIYNSNLNDPTAWTAGNFISCEMFPDEVNHFAKLNNYLVVFGTSSIEYFWDAANASGSPLQRNDTPVKLVGYLGGFAQHGGRIYFLGNTTAGTPDVYALEDLKMENIGNAAVRKYLEVQAGDLGNSSATIVSFMGNDFYVFTIGPRTYVFDLKAGLWTNFAFKNNLNMYITHSVCSSSPYVPTSIVYINNEPNLLKFNPTVYQDDGVNFTMRTVTGNHYFGSYNQKAMHRLTITSDRPTTDASMDVYWTDDDYQTYTSSQAVNLNQELPSLTRLGRFRKRAFKLELTANVPLRLKRLEVDINLGQH